MCNYREEPGTPSPVTQMIDLVDRTLTAMETYKDDAEELSRLTDNITTLSAHFNLATIKVSEKIIEHMPRLPNLTKVPMLHMLERIAGQDPQTHPVIHAGISGMLETEKLPGVQGWMKKVADITHPNSALQRETKDLMARLGVKSNP